MTLKSHPRPPRPRRRHTSGGATLPTVQISADSLLRALPAGLRTNLAQQIDLMHVVENRPVALMSPDVLTVM